jgi:hypothetical protein
MSSHLIYHPSRVSRSFDGTVVHYDRTSGNQDPFIWNRSFLHTFCHMTQLRDPRPGDINFWVSSPRLQRFSTLLCDLVFVISERHQWRERNRISEDDPIVDSAISYQDHYRWAMRQHRLVRRHRKTLKADPDRSFQPQAADGSLIDVVPLLTSMGYPLSRLREGLINGYQSKPLAIEQTDAKALYDLIQQRATRQLRGKDLGRIRAREPELQSRW